MNINRDPAEERPEIHDIKNKKTLVIGCGNVLMGDDGFGPAVIKYMAENMHIPEDAGLVDAGAGVREILFDIMLSGGEALEAKHSRPLGLSSFRAGSGPERIIIADAVDAGKKPGEIFEMNLDGMPEKKSNDFSMHQLPASNLLMELKKHCKMDVRVIAVQPEFLPGEIKPGLSRPVAEAVPAAGNRIFEIVKILLSAAVVFLVSGCNELWKDAKRAGGNYWQGDTFVQRNIDVSKSETGTIRAKVDGKWQTFGIRELPEGFIKWKKAAAIRMLEAMRKQKMPGVAGSAHHFGAVATCGGHRDDADFSINNAFKGIGFLPARHKIKAAIRKLQSTRGSSFQEKLNVLKGFHDTGDFEDKTKLCSLELYTTKNFQTHTFRNIMTDPSVSIVFLDIPSYEVRAICQLVHPKDETASQYHRDIVEYVNLLHDYFHGKARRKAIVMIFHVNQVFDNSPRSRGMKSDALPDSKMRIR